MSAGFRTDLVTVEQFYALAGDGRKADLIDVDWFFADPLPKAQAKLDEILAASA